METKQKLIKFLTKFKEQQRTFLSQRTNKKMSLFILKTFESHMTLGVLLIYTCQYLCVLLYIYQYITTKTYVYIVYSVAFKKIIVHEYNRYSFGPSLSLAHATHSIHLIFYHGNFSKHFKSLSTKDTTTTNNAQCSNKINHISAPQLRL